MIRTQEAASPDNHQQRALVDGRRAVGGALLLSLLACTPSPEPGDDTAPTSSAPTSGVTASPAPDQSASTAPPAPQITNEEVARSVHAALGSDGVPETTDTISGGITSQKLYEVRGSCSGSRTTMPFTVWTAAPDEDRTTLVEGSITCDGRVETARSADSFDVEGLAQLSITRTDGVSHGWVILTATEGE